jgi:DNA polymerase III epsilon subunit-like protein
MKNNFGLIMENWRGYKNKLNEIRGVHSYYGATYEEFRSAYDEIKNNTFIFFDTETTGLGSAKRYNQITQIAAVAVTPGTEGYQSFNVKIHLEEDTEGFIDWQQKKVEQGQEFPFTHKQAFKLTSYGEPSTQRRRLRKAARQLGKKIEQSGDKSRLIGALPEPTKFMSLKEALEEFNKFVNKFPERTLIAQNAPFDVDYFIQAYVRADVPSLPDIAVDTVQIFNRFFKPILQVLKSKKEAGEQLEPADEKMLNALTKSYTRIDKKTGEEKQVHSLTVSLGPLANAFGVQATGWHDALADVTMLHEILNKVIEYLDGNKEVVMALPAVQKQENPELGPPVPGHLSKRKPIKPSDA